MAYIVTFYIITKCYICYKSFISIKVTFPIKVAYDPENNSSDEYGNTSPHDLENNSSDDHKRFYLEHCWNNIFTLYCMDLLSSRPDIMQEYILDR